MFETISIEVFSYLITIGIASVGSFCGLLYRCVHRQAKRGYRLSQAILLLTKSIEEQMMYNHKDYKGGLHAEAKIILKDENGLL